MQQKVLHRHLGASRPSGGHVGVGGVDEDALIGELGQIAGNGIVELEPVLLPEDHGGQAGDGARHRVEAEQRVAAHREPAFPVELAEGLEVRQPAVPHDGGHHAGDVSRVDMSLQPAGCVVQPFRREPDRFRRRRRQVLRGHGGASGGEAADGDQNGDEPGCHDALLLRPLGAPRHLTSTVGGCCRSWRRRTSSCRRTIV